MAFLIHKYALHGILYHGKVEVHRQKKRMILYFSRRIYLLLQLSLDRLEETVHVQECFGIAYPFYHLKGFPCFI